MTAALCITPRVDAAGQPVLVVVAAPGALTAAENVIAQRLTIAGYDVVFADDTTVTAADATGKAFVLVAQSTTATRPAPSCAACRPDLGRQALPVRRRSG